jgi:hypothetical protein
MIPKNVAGISIPDSKIAREAIELSRDASPEFLFNHVMRTFAFGMLLAEARQWTVEPELFLLGAVLHDLGVTEKGHGPQRFEVEGADWARRFLLEKGCSEARADVVWDAIALHTSLGIADRKVPEIALVHLGAGADVIGMQIDRIPANRVDAVLATFPRLAIKQSLVAAFRETIEANPGSAVHTFTMDMAREIVPGFSCPSFAQLIQAAPFAE